MVQESNPHSLPLKVEDKPNFEAENFSPQILTDQKIANPFSFEIQAASGQQ